MPSHRKFRSLRECTEHRPEIDESLIGKIVMFKYLKRPPLFRDNKGEGAVIAGNLEDFDTLILRVFTILVISPDDIYGEFIAGDIERFTVSGAKKLTLIYKRQILDYRILTAKEFPLLMGYKYTSPLLVALLKGD